jgi:hypothetical protein
MSSVVCCLALALLIPAFDNIHAYLYVASQIVIPTCIWYSQTGHLYQVHQLPALLGACGLCNVFAHLTMNGMFLQWGLAIAMTCHASRVMFPEDHNKHETSQSSLVIQNHTQSSGIRLHDERLSGPRLIVPLLLAFGTIVWFENTNAMHPEIRGIPIWGWYRFLHTVLVFIVILDLLQNAAFIICPDVAPDMEDADEAPCPGMENTEINPADTT